jgi:transposase-like protein
MFAFAKLKRDAERAGQKVGPSISAVAREAGVSHALIHNKYADIADEIRKAGGRSPQQLLEKQRVAAEKAEVQKSELREELAALKQENRGLASENARLLLLVASLQQQVSLRESGVTTIKPHHRSQTSKLPRL